MRTKGTCCVSCTARNAAALTPPPLSICSACAGEAFKAAKAAITNSEGTDGSDSGDADSDTAADSTGGPTRPQRERNAPTPFRPAAEDARQQALRSKARSANKSKKAGKGKAAGKKAFWAENHA